MAESLYREAGQIIPVDSELWLKVLNPELWDAIKAYSANVDRARAFWRIQPYLIEHATINTQKLCYAAWDLTGKPFVPVDDAALAQTITLRLTAEFEKRFKETGSRDIAAGYDFERALDRFEAFVKFDPDFQKEVYGTFLTQLVMTWTAFETLAGDLWRAILICDPEAIEKPESHRFHLLDKMRIAYKVLIPPSQKIDTILAEIGLRKLNLVRNVALHKAGIVDQKFIGDAAGISWIVPDEVNQPIKLDGERVRDLINPVIQCGLDLINAVDKWITIKRPGKERHTMTIFLRPFDLLFLFGIAPLGVPVPFSARKESAASLCGTSRRAF